MAVPRSLTTSRLVLEATAPDHAPAIYDAARISLDELAPWMPWAATNSLAQTQAFAETAAQDWERHRAWVFTILFDGEVAGTVGLHEHRPLIELAAIGYWVRSDRARRGIVTEAAAAVCDFGFDELGLHRIALEAGVDNVASVRVAEKLGFTREGVVRDASRGVHGYYDCYLFGLLATDPRPWRTRGAASRAGGRPGTPSGRA